MKQIYSIIVILFFAITVHAQIRPVITFMAASGDWSKASNWDLNRIPQNNDTIIIPENTIAVFDKGDTLANVFIKIEGGLTLKKKLKLSASSVIELTTTGKVNASGTNRSVEEIYLGGVPKFDQNAAQWVYGSGFAASTSGVSPNGFNLMSMPIIALPVLFNSFYATKSNNNVNLNWSTAQENNNQHFEIQRSLDGNNWSVIAIMLGAGNSDVLKQYSYTDKNMTSAVAWYRIRQVDIDGKYTYSTVKTIRAGEAMSAARIYTTGNVVNIEFNKEIKNLVTVRIINMNGQVIGQRNNQQASYRLTIPVGNQINGMYLVQLNDNAGYSEVRKVIL
ncbi:T9SS type A sorting domain-containing protein [Longitalea luteola]|uniref:T9SS type A sorting domain-containing protein n=1 Tax=Longitalea luteola TaxID=2812563 RepID=UPI001A968864|nr:T9SS type A sorting domain-containing protein [Longitalea luteola]